MREAPLHRLDHVRTRGVDEFADVSEDRLREISGLRDVGVNAWVFRGHEEIVSELNAVSQFQTLTSVLESASFHQG
jgi:hypothetical protein